MFGTTVLGHISTVLGHISTVLGIITDRTMGIGGRDIIGLTTTAITGRIIGPTTTDITGPIIGLTITGPTTTAITGPTTTIGETPALCPLWVKSRHRSAALECPLSANSGH